MPTAIKTSNWGTWIVVFVVVLLTLIAGLLFIAK